MDRKSFKSKPYHLKQKHSGEIEKTIHSADTDIGSSSSPADLRVYGTAYFDDPALGANTFVMGHRISVSGSAPIPTSNVPSASVLYLTPYTSEYVALHDGDHWRVRQTSMVTKSLTELTASNTNYDVFTYWNRENNVVDLNFEAWSGNTTRATSLARKDGVLVSGNDSTKRYVGTIRTVNVAGVTADCNSRRFVWNYYNKSPRTLKQFTVASDWIYAGTAWRAANNNIGVNSFEYVTGEADFVEARVHSVGTSVTNGYGICVGIGIDTATSNSAIQYGGVSNGSHYSTLVAHYSGYTTGYHRFTWLEVTGGNSTTFYGNIGQPDYFGFGIIGTLRC